MDVKLSTIEREVLVAPESPLHESPFKRKGRKWMNLFFFLLFMVAYMELFSHWSWKASEFLTILCQIYRILLGVVEQNYSTTNSCWRFSLSPSLRLEFYSLSHKRFWCHEWKRGGKRQKKTGFIYRVKTKI
jgi:hypothetical protein